MDTVLIFSDFMNLPVYFYIPNAPNLTKFEGFVGGTCCDADDEDSIAKHEELDKEFTKLIYDYDGKFKLKQITADELHQLDNNGSVDFFVNCGFAP